VDVTDLPLPGRVVQDVVRCGRQVRVELSGAYQLVIEAAFSVAGAGSAERTDPEDPAVALGPRVRALAGRTVTTAASSGGNLGVECAGGVRLDVPVDDSYEAWQLHGPDGYRVVCTPGGELAVWSAQ